MKHENYIQLLKNQVLTSSKEYPCIHQIQYESNQIILLILDQIDNKSQYQFSAYLYKILFLNNL